MKGQKFTLLIGNYLEPISRPSVMGGIRAETLWRVGPREAVGWIFELPEESPRQTLTLAAEPKKED